MIIKIQHLSLISFIFFLQSCATQGIYSSQYLERNDEPNEFTSDISHLEITLPDGIDWANAKEYSANGEEYTYLWLPKGETEKSYSWYAALAKYNNKHSEKALTLHLNYFESISKTCTNMKTIGPDIIKIDGHDTTVSRVMCAYDSKQKYGYFGDVRIVSAGHYAYVVSSYVITPKTEEAGVIKFDPKEFNANEFYKHTDLSARFVRENIRICFKSSENCK